MLWYLGVDHDRLAEIFVSLDRLGVEVNALGIRRSGECRWPHEKLFPVLKVHRDRIRTWMCSSPKGEITQAMHSPRRARRANRTCLAALSYTGPLGTPLVIMGTTRPRITQAGSREHEPWYWLPSSDPYLWPDLSHQLGATLKILLDQIRVNEYHGLYWYVGAPDPYGKAGIWLEVSDHLVRARTPDAQRAELERILTSTDTESLPSRTWDELVNQARQTLPWRTAIDEAHMPAKPPHRT